MKAFDIPCLEQAGFEADDLIATYARLACEAKATATIVSSDKDLMQLVNDCVVMYDTMKDKQIGIPEVIEKFGVPPDKVIEVQALIGDSTDNVPGVPGIGVKTAAQLIGEYGDLETLLKRAGEIKQDKRRQTLIDNAELARISKRLVTLDQNVALEVPVEELAVHEPDYKHLVAFLKAMEFNTLTRRVAEKSGIEAGEIEADAKLTSGSASRSSPPPSAGSRRPVRRAPSPTLPRRRGRETAWHQRRQRQGAHARRARGRASGGRARGQVRPRQIRDRPHARPAEGLGAARAGTWASSRSTPRRPASIRSPRSSSASRLRSPTTKPATCRSATATAARRAAAICLRRKPSLRRTRFRRSRRSKSSRSCWKTRA